MSNDNSELDLTIQMTIVKLLQTYVKWGPSRESLLHVATKKDREAAYERGMADNYSTAARLNFEAQLHRLAAEVRYPRDGQDKLLIAYSHEIKQSLVSIIMDIYDQDVGDHQKITSDRIRYAISETIDLNDINFMNRIMGHLAKQNLLDDSDFWRKDYQLRIEDRNLFSREDTLSALATLTKNTILKLVRSESISTEYSRDEIDLIAKELRREAQIEYNWDNHNTSDKLNFQSDMYELTSEIRHPGVESPKLAFYIKKIREIILEEILHNRCEEIKSYSEIQLIQGVHSVENLSDINTLNILIDNLADTGDIKNPEQTKLELKLRLEYETAQEQNYFRM